MLIRAEEAIQKANRIVRQCGTRNADRIARELGLIVMSRDFSRQKGAYMVIERNRYIFINNLFNKEYCNQALGNQLIPSMPRNFMLSASYTL